MMERKSLERVDRSPREFEIVIMGRSNVGKSTLIREFAGVKVPVGRKPGVTRKINHIHLGDLTITDMPGFGFMSGVPKEKVERIKDNIVHYVEDNSEYIKLAIQVLDGKAFTEIVDRWVGRGEVPVDVEMYEFLTEEGIDTILAVNKMDKMSDLDRELNEIVSRLGMEPPWQEWDHIVAPTCAKKGDLGALRELVKERFHKHRRDELLKYIKQNRPK